MILSRSYFWADLILGSKFFFGLNIFDVDIFMVRHFFCSTFFGSTKNTIFFLKINFILNDFSQG